MRTFNDDGYSFVELIAVLAIATIIAAQAIPAMFEMSEGLNRTSAKDVIEHDINRVKSESVASGARGIVQLNVDGSGYTVGLDRAPVANPPTIEEVIFTRTLPNDVFLNLPEDEIIMFDSRGLLVDEFGEPTTVQGSLLQQGDDFTQIYIYPVGRVCYGDSCAQI